MSLSACSEAIRLCYAFVQPAKSTVVANLSERFSIKCFANKSHRLRMPRKLANQVEKKSAASTGWKFHPRKGLEGHMRKRQGGCVRVSATFYIYHPRAFPWPATEDLSILLTVSDIVTAGSICRNPSPKCLITFSLDPSCPTVPCAMRE